MLGVCLEKCSSGKFGLGNGRSDCCGSGASGPWSCVTANTPMPCWRPRATFRRSCTPRPPVPSCCTSALRWRRVPLKDVPARRPEVVRTNMRQNEWSSSDPLYVLKKNTTPTIPTSQNNQEDDCTNLLDEACCVNDETRIHARMRVLGSCVHATGQVTRHHRVVTRERRRGCVSATAEAPLLPSIVFLIKIVQDHAIQYKYESLGGWLVPGRRFATHFMNAFVPVRRHS